MFVHKLRKQLSPCHLAMFGMLCISGCSKKTDNVTYFIERERERCEHAIVRLYKTESWTFQLVERREISTSAVGLSLKVLLVGYNSVADNTRLSSFI